MDLIRILMSRCAALIGRRKLDEDLDEELRAHIDMSVEENRKRGMSNDEALRAALRQFGGVTQTKEAYRVQRGVPFIEMMIQDARYALRQLGKSPGFATVAILTLALGIGANTAIFSVVQGVVLAPLPYRQSDRLMMLWESRPNVEKLSVSYPDFRDWQRRARSFERMAGLTLAAYNLTSPGSPENLRGMAISADFFATLGVQLELGREFSAAEDRPHGMPAALISDRLWKERFASSPEVLGKTVTLDGVATPIIGVLPSGFRLWTDSDVDVCTPLGQNELLSYNDRTSHGIASIARLKPEVSMGQAQADLGSIQENLDHLYPVEDQKLGINLTPLKQAIVGDVGGTLLLLWGAVGIVLLIACTNVANLLLARSAARTREFAIRAALGASRARMVRQLLTESVLLALTGGIFGLIIAKLGVSLVLVEFPDSLPRTENIGVNLAAFIFAFGISLAVGILFGLAPALKISRADVQGSLKDGDHGSLGGGSGNRGSGRTHSRGQSALVIVQMALTLVLLVGAGLLLRTIRQL